MLTAAAHPGFGMESSSEGSPYTTSSEDLFADINWPEDEIDTPSDEGFCQSSGSTDPENASPMDGVYESNISPIETNGHVEPLCPADSLSKQSSGSRFSKEARSTLRTWFNEHRDNPYPTAKEKEELAAKTNLKSGQISLWLVNTRRRYRSRKQHDAHLYTIPQELQLSSSSPNPSQVGQMAMENSSRPELRRPEFDRPFEELNPMDRWKVTGIEYEPVASPIIMGTVAAAPPLSFDPYDVSVKYRHQPPSCNDQSDHQSAVVLSQHDSYLGRSLASYDCALTSMVTASTLSDSTGYSYPSTHISQNSRVGNNGSRDRRRRRGHPSKTPKFASRDRPFQCTFCAECTFATKHDWQRHEKSQHLTLESWTCCLSGGTIDGENGPVCVFCDKLNPDTRHMETHNFLACQEKDIHERTFYRKDHIQQHLRLTHEAKFNSRMNSWKTEVPMVRSRCGFCSANFTTWSARADHLASHFKCHANMRDWVGDWGFEPHIAALVERIPANTPRLNPQFTESCMPPPPRPYNKILHGGIVDYMHPLQEQILEIDWLGSMDEMGSGIGPPGISGSLGVEGVEVTDWVNFGI